MVVSPANTTKQVYWEGWGRGEREFQEESGSGRNLEVMNGNPEFWRGAPPKTRARRDGSWWVEWGPNWIRACGPEKKLGRHPGLPPSVCFSVAPLPGNRIPAFTPRSGFAASLGASARSQMGVRNENRSHLPSRPRRAFSQPTPRLLDQANHRICSSIVGDAQWAFFSLVLAVHQGLALLGTGNRTSACSAGRRACQPGGSSKVPPLLQLCCGGTSILDMPEGSWLPSFRRADSGC